MVALRLDYLSKIGLALSAERDIRRLLAMILSISRELTASDGGTLYIVEPDGNGGKSLYFRATQNDSITVDGNMSFAVGANSLAGYAALSGEILRYDDVYNLPPDAPFKFNPLFDLEHDYRTKSVLVVPLKNHVGEVIGVLQLINRKRRRETILSSPEIVEREVLGFDPDMAQLAATLASQAAVALNNNLLLQEIEDLFESLVVAASSAIETRDPSTSGHSRRVTNLTLELARAVSLTTDGPLADARFSLAEMKGVALRVFAARLRQNRGARGGFDQKSQNRAHTFLRNPRARLGLAAPLRSAMRRPKFARLARRRAQCRRLSSAMRSANARARPATARGHGRHRNHQRPDARAARRSDLGARARGDCALVRARMGGRAGPDGADFKRRRSRRFERFARHFDARRVWANSRSRPDVVRVFEADPVERRAGARARHRPRAPRARRRGSGYPRGLRAEDIPLGAQLMAIADVYDALTAADRPYKRALPTETALKILRAEANAGKLNAAALDVFIAREVYRAND